MIELICSHCGAPFQKYHSRMAYCSALCRNAAKMRRWREGHPEQQRAIEARYRAANREAVLARMRSWHVSNKEKQNAKRRAHHHANRDHANAQRRKWSQEHPEQQKMTSAATAQRARIALPWKPLLKSAEERARKKNVPFTLTPEWAVGRWTGRCEVTNVPFGIGLRVSGPKLLSPSIDRRVPALGYVPENCRFVIWAVNALKYDGSDDDMIAIARLVVEYADRRDIGSQT